jgi:hypothetical protein
VIITFAANDRKLLLDQARSASRLGGLDDAAAIELASLARDEARCDEQHDGEGEDGDDRLTDGLGDLNTDPDEMKNLAGDAKHRFTWDGRDDEGNVVPDGTYRMRVVRRDESRVIDSVKEISVDTVPPRVTLVSATPSAIATGLPGEPPRVELRYRGPRNKAPVVRVFRTGEGRPRIVRRFRGGSNRTATWDGSVSAGPERTEPAPEGDYAFTVAVRDKAGLFEVAPEVVRMLAANAKPEEAGR